MTTSTFDASPIIIDQTPTDRRIEPQRPYYDPSASRLAQIRRLQAELKKALDFGTCKIVPNGKVKK